MMESTGPLPLAQKCSVTKLINVPTISPTTIVMKIFIEAYDMSPIENVVGKRYLMTKNDAIAVSAIEPKLPILRATCGLLVSFLIFTKFIPTIEKMIPIAQIIKGNNTPDIPAILSPVVTTLIPNIIVARIVLT